VGARRVLALWALDWAWHHACAAQEAQSRDQDPTF